MPNEVHSSHSHDYQLGQIQATQANQCAQLHQILEQSRKNSDRIGYMIEQHQKHEIRISALENLLKYVKATLTLLITIASTLAGWVGYIFYGKA